MSTPPRIWITCINSCEAHATEEAPDWQHGVWYPHDFTGSDKNATPYTPVDPGDGRPFSADEFLRRVCDTHDNLAVIMERLNAWNEGAWDEAVEGLDPC